MYDGMYNGRICAVVKSDYRHMSREIVCSLFVRHVSYVICMYDPCHAARLSTTDARFLSTHRPGLRESDAASWWP